MAQCDLIRPSLTLAIVTAARPELAQRCAESYLANHSHPARLLILDDSVDQNAEVLQGLALHLKKTPGASVRYGGRAERRFYAGQLARLGVPADVAHYALLGDAAVSFTAGANRNAALLETVGQHVLMADDDTIAITAASPHATDRPLIAGHTDPTDIAFFDSSGARAKALWSEVDLLTETGRLLSTSPLDLDAEYDGVCQHLANDPGVIRVTSYGVVGDSGFYSPSHLLWMASPAVDDALRQSASLLSTAFNSREVIRIVPRVTVTHATVCMATTIGLDHTRMLPPFLPVLRNEDGFFGNLMTRAFPNAYTAHLPFAVIHSPPGYRAYQRLPHQPQTLRFSELIILLMSASPSGSLEALGEFLVDAAREHFESFARQVVRTSRQRMLQTIEDGWSQSRTQATVDWHRQADALRARLRELIASPNCYVPSDLPATELRRLVTLTGRLLLVWEQMLAASRQLAAEGVHITA